MNTTMQNRKMFVVMLERMIGKQLTKKIPSTKSQTTNGFELSLPSPNTLFPSPNLQLQINKSQNPNIL